MNKEKFTYRTIKKHISVSLKRKMQVLMYGLVFPLILFIIYLIVRMSAFSNDYDSIYDNISIANNFSQEFKNNYDSGMYQIVAGSSDFERENIFEQLENAKTTTRTLRKGAFLIQNKGNTKRILEYLEILERSTKTIQNNLSLNGPKYNKNLSILENDIYTTTELINDLVQKYVYYETLQMDKVRLQIEKETKNTYTFACGIFIIILILSMVIIEIFSSSITKPLKKLCSSAKLVGEGDFTTRVPEFNGDEITTLTTGFNTMIEKIGSLIEDVRLEQLNLRKTELKLMQAQINPHFLYNTLDTIVWLAEDNQNKDVVQMVGALSRFFRIVLSKGYDTVTLKEEELLIRSYLQIQQYRYQDILEYEINIPEEIYEYRILNLTLQPIVENALYHGIKNRRGKGKITVEGCKKQDTIKLRIKDNGIGMDEKQLSKIRCVLGGEELDLGEGKKGFGLKNVNERIQLNFGKEYGITITSEYGVGTEFTVCIPAITETTIR